MLLFSTRSRAVGQVVPDDSGGMEKTAWWSRRVGF